MGLQRQACVFNRAVPGGLVTQGNSDSVLPPEEGARHALPVIEPVSITEHMIWLCAEHMRHIHPIPAAVAAAPFQRMLASYTHLAHPGMPHWVPTTICY